MRSNEIVIHTDGACKGNPGPGGWGAVIEQNGGQVKLSGSAPQTTNNRMELKALIQAYKSLPKDARVTLYSDSPLCVNTIKQWAASWERRGWKRKTGPIANLELVKELYHLAGQQPNATLKWIKAHDGSKWNEYADALATTYMREG